MSIEPPPPKSSSKSKQKIRKFEYAKKYGTSALQHVLLQPTSQQMMGTPGTQWKEINTVVNILDKLSLQYFDHRNNFRGGKLI